eukprot:Gb_04275 [translate_table: standard]
MLQLEVITIVSWHDLPKLKHLKLLGCYILPHTMEFLAFLEKMDLEGFHALTSLKGIGLGKLEKVAWMSIRNYMSLSSLPTKEMVQMKSLRPTAKGEVKCANGKEEEDFKEELGSPKGQREK